MTNREKRALKRQFDSQVSWERNAAAAGQSWVPPEIASGMTRPIEPEPLYQVIVQQAGGGGLLPVGPRVLKPVAEEFAAVINKFVAAGKEKTWRNAQVIACLTKGVQ